MEKTLLKRQFWFDLKKKFFEMRVKNWLEWTTQMSKI